MREAFERDGFLLLPSLFTTDEVAEIKCEISRVLESVRQAAAEQGQDPERVIHGGVFVGLAARSDACARLARDSRILDILESACFANIEFLSDKVVLKSRATDFGTPW